MAESRHIAETEINDYDNEQGEIQACKGDIIDDITQDYVDKTFQRLFDESPSELEIDSIDDEWSDSMDVWADVLLTDPNDDDYNALENFGS